MWSRFKTFFKEKVVPASILVVRIIATGGWLKFALERTADYFHLSRHPALPYVVGTGVGINAVTNVLCGGPALKRSFEQNNSTEPSTKDPHTHWGWHSDINAAGNFIINSGKVSGRLSTVFSFLVFYLGAIKLVEPLLGDLFSEEAEDEAYKRTIIHSASLGIAALNALYFYYVKVRNIDKNAGSIAQQITHDDMTFEEKRARTKAFFYTSGNLASAPFTAYFSTFNALGNFPFVEVPVGLQHSLSITSAVIAFYTALIGDIVPVYNFVKTKKPTYFESLPCEKSLSAIVHTIGFGDAVFNSATTAISILTLLHGLYNEDYSAYLIAVVCTVSKIGTGFAFHVHSSIEDTKEAAHKKRNHTIIPSTQLNDEHKPLISASDNLTRVTIINSENNSIDIRQSSDSIPINSGKGTTVDNNTILNNNSLGENFATLFGSSSQKQKAIDQEVLNLSFG